MFFCLFFVLSKSAADTFFKKFSSARHLIDCNRLNNNYSDGSLLFETATWWLVVQLCNGWLRSVGNWSEPNELEVGFASYEWGNEINCNKNFSIFLFLFLSGRLKVTLKVRPIVATSEPTELESTRRESRVVTMTTLPRGAVTMATQTKMECCSARFLLVFFFCLSFTKGRRPMQCLGTSSTSFYLRKNDFTNFPIRHAVPIYTVISL